MEVFERDNQDEILIDLTDCMQLFALSGMIGAAIHSGKLSESAKVSGDDGLYALELAAGRVAQDSMEKLLTAIAAKGIEVVRMRDLLLGCEHLAYACGHHS